MDLNPWIDEEVARAADACEYGIAAVKAAFPRWKRARLRTLLYSPRIRESLKSWLMWEIFAPRFYVAYPEIAKSFEVGPPCEEGCDVCFYVSLRDLGHVAAYEKLCAAARAS